MEKQKIALENFEGPLDLLLHLIQKNEINIYDIPVQAVTSQFLLQEIDEGAEFLSSASLLLLLKSERLLPQTDARRGGKDAYLSILQGILEYCSLKEVSKKLQIVDEGIYFTREVPEEYSEPMMPDISLQELSAVFQKLMERKGPEPKIIKQEGFLVSECMEQLRVILSMKEKVPFEEVFALEKSKEELIALFLALLQLMKTQEARFVEGALCKRT